jgi:TonB-linked SusC/RagA family outer membrane protein
VTITTNHKEYKLRSNLDAEVTQWLDFSLKLSAGRSHSKNGGMDMNGALAFSPTMELKDPVTGIYNRDPFNCADKNNPYGDKMVNYDDSYSNSAQANAIFLFKIIDGLTLSVQGAYNIYSGKGYEFSSRLRTAGAYDDMSNSSSESHSWQNINNLTYAKKFGEHSLTATAVWEMSQYEKSSLNGNGSKLSNGDIVGYWNIKNAASRDASNGYVGSSMASGLGRVMYNYGGRYFVTGAFRADGSSKFQGDNKWGYFPSGAIAWDLAQEGFMADQDLFQQLKLRASYGVTGNQGIGSYETLGMLQETEKYGWGTPTFYTGYWSNSYKSSHLRWEKTYQGNIGLDVSMLDSKLNLTVEYFNKQSKDLLFQTTLPGYMGGGPGNKTHGGQVWVNQGQIDNRGVEFAINAFPLDNTSPVQWETSFNASYVKNEIVDMAGEEEIRTANYNYLGGNAQIMKLGYPFGSFHLYPMKGFDSNGAYLYENADGSLTTSPAGDGQRIMGQCSPAWTFGWNNSVSYKNWTLNLFFNAATGFHRLNTMRFMLSSSFGPYRFIRLNEAYQKGWDKVSDKSQAEYPNYKNGEVKFIFNGDKWLENASFIKLRNISLSYDIPKDLVKFANIQLSVSGQNVLTLTKYTGMDPEVYNADEGVDSGAYPLPRTFTFGARFTF